VDLICFRALKIKDAAFAMAEDVCQNLMVPAPAKSAKTLGVSESFPGPSWAYTPDGQSAAVCAQLRCTVLSQAAVEARFTHEVACIGDDPLENESNDHRMREAALRVRDALTLSVVLPEAVYAPAAKALRARLIGRRPMVNEVSTVVGWASPVQLHSSSHSGSGGVMVNLAMPGEDDGVAFTPDDAYPFVIELHTPSSLQASIGITAAWSEFRGANLPSQRVAALARARELAARVALPPGIADLVTELESEAREED
jgi:hypothetical protein